MKVISVIAEKGGVAKTTTAQAIIEELRAKGFKVLAIDLDQQANLSFVLKADKNPYSIFNLLTTDKEHLKDKKTIDQVIKNDTIKADTQASLLSKESMNSLRDALKPIKNKYDFIVIDTPPKLDRNILRVLIATDYVILPTLADAFSLKGLDTIYKLIEDIKPINPTIKIGGILFTMYNNRGTLSKQLKELIEERAHAKGVYCFKTTINRNIAISEAQALQIPITIYNTKVKATQDYKRFINELIDILK